jgi:hypothetical protein
MKWCIEGRKGKIFLMGAAALLLGMATLHLSTAYAEETKVSDKTMVMQGEKLNLVQGWDKVFPKSEKVTHNKVTFSNRYGITLAADVYSPKDIAEKLPAVAVCGPYGAVKEQSSGLYAQTLAERGFLAVAFDPSFTGESGGVPRSISSPDINIEDYSAAIDYLITRPDVDEGRIGIVGICGWGRLAVSAAIMDARIKATMSSTMGTTMYAFDHYTPEERIKERRRLGTERTSDVKNHRHKLAGGVPAPNELAPDTPQAWKDYSDYYKTPRGYHARSLNSNDGWQTVTSLPFMNFPLLTYANEIESAVLLVHGTEAYSLDASKETYAMLKGKNKELYLVPNARHTDLYDKPEYIPFDKIEKFFRENLR